ncbi:MAG: alpha/beta hydrolase [Planctomycetes bacterium]|nr:alpha/beta hydrolase [Planctomycetota bacterium]
MSGPRFLERPGPKLAYYVAGSGPAALWIQGVGVAASGWGPQIEALSARFVCCSYDHPGLGASEPAHEPTTVAGMARDALAVLDAARVERAHVVGHSLGGLVALALGLAAPARVASLALACTFANGRAPGRTPRMMWLGARTVLGTRAMRRAAFVDLVTSSAGRRAAPHAAWAARLSSAFGRDVAELPRAARGQLAAMRACDLRGELQRLAGIPTWVVSAAEDPIAPPALGEELARLLPGARFEVLAHASHALGLEHPAWFNARLAEHFTLAEHAPRGFRTP